MGPSPPSIGPDTTLHIFNPNNLQRQGDRVTLGSQQLALLHDTVIRAMRAAEQADRLCTAAAAAFRQEWAVARPDTNLSGRLHRQTPT